MSNEALWIEWIQKLKKIVSDITNNSSSIIIHKAKLYCLFQDLKEFEKNATTILPSLINNIQPNFSALNETLSYLLDFENFLQDLYSDNYLKNAIYSSTDFVKNNIALFRAKFNSSIEQANICFLVPLTNKIEQLEIDDHSDLKHLEICLLSLKTDSNLMEKMNIDSQKLDLSIEDFSKAVKQYESSFISSTKAVPSDANVLTASLENLQMPVTDSNDFEKQKLIGQGSFADVFIGYKKSNHEAVAIKILHPDSLTSSSRLSIDSFRNEIRILSLVNHFAILKVIGICPSPPLMIITELMTGGSLFERLHNSKQLDPSHKTIIALGIAYGMNYLHSQGIIHRDLKSSNILLDDNDFPRISDFGASCKIKKGELVNQPQGTPAWSAPEMLQGLSYGSFVDVYSYGIILWELLTGEVPFKALTPYQIVQEVCINDKRPNLPPINLCPQPLADLIQKCWAKEPDQRPTFSFIINLLEKCDIMFPGSNPEIIVDYISQNKSSSKEMTINSNASFINSGSSMNKQFEVKQDLTFKSNIDTIDINSNNSNHSNNSDNSQDTPNLLKTNNINEMIDKCFSGKKVDYNKMLEILINMDLDINSSIFQTISEKLIPFLINIASTSNDSEFANLWFQFFQKVLPIKPLHLNNLLSNAIFLFTRCGNNSMTSFLSIVEQLIPKTKYIFQSNEISKMSSFVLSSDSQSRDQIVSIFSHIIKKELYVSINDFNSIIPHFAQIIRPDSSPIVLSQIIEILQFLALNEEPPSNLCQYEVLNTFFSLMNNHPNDNLKQSSYNLMRIILEKFDSIPSSFVLEFLRCLNEVKTNCKNSLNYLALLSILSHSNSFDVIKSSNIISNILLYFIQSSDKAVSIYTLKLCYYYVAKRNASFIFAGHLSVFINNISIILINQSQDDNQHNLTISNNLAIASISGYILTVVIPEIGISDEYLNDHLFTILEKGILENDNYSLRVLGAISSTANGSIFAEKFIPKILELISLITKSSKHSHKMIISQNQSNLDLNNKIPPTNDLEPSDRFLERSSEQSKSSKSKKSKSNKIIKEKYTNNPENGPIAIDVLCEIAYNRPFSYNLIVCLPQMNNLIDNPLYTKPVITFIETLVVNPKASEESISLIPKLLSHLGNEDLDSHIFTTLYSIISAPEAASKISGKILTLFIDRTKEKYWDGPFALQSFRILEILSVYPELKKKMIDKQIVIELETKMLSFGSSVPKSIVLRRLLCRLNDEKLAKSSYPP